MFKKILAAVDLENSDITGKILQIAADIANDNAAGLHVLSIISSAPVVVSQHLPQGYEKLAMKKTRQDLATLSASINLAQGDVTCSSRFGDVYREILAYADKTGIDLIVIGCSKRHATDFLLGTNAARVVRHASCSVFVVR